MIYEKELEKIDNEIKAMKASFQQDATSLNVYTTKIKFTTSANLIQWNGNGHYVVDKYPWLESLVGITSDGQGNYSGYGRERVEVTFDCDKGLNTFASLEINLIDANDWGVWVKRVPYSGGSKWIVLFTPNGNYDGQGQWQSWRPTTVEFAVQSAATGVLGAKMIWQ